MSEGQVLSTLRVRVGAEDVHYGGGLVAGAFCMKLFGDLATEVTIRTDGHDGLREVGIEVVHAFSLGAIVVPRARATSSGSSSRRACAPGEPAMTLKTSTSHVRDVVPRRTSVARASR